MPLREYLRLPKKKRNEPSRSPTPESSARKPEYGAQSAEADHHSAISSQPAESSTRISQDESHTEDFSQSNPTSKDQGGANGTERWQDVTIGKGLWAEACKPLDENQLRQLESLIVDGNGDLQSAAKEKLEAIKARRQRIRIGKNKEIVVRDAVTKVINTLRSYSAPISAAIAAEPHASLAWGGVAALLPILCTAFTQTDSAMDSLDGITTILVQFRAIEVIYDLSECPEEKFVASSQIKDVHSQLRNQVIDLYRSIIQYQIDLHGHFSKSQLGRVPGSIFPPLPDAFTAIKDLATSAENSLQTLDSGAIARIDNELSSVREQVELILGTTVEMNRNLLNQLRVQRIEKLPRAAFAAFDEGPGGDVPDPCHEGTRNEVLDIIRRWGEGEHGNENCICWLSGMAGTGKSTIARTIARDFSQKGTLGASFFFKRGQIDRTEVEKFFSTLARGLVRTVSGFDECLHKSIESVEIEQKSLKDQWEALILGPLRALESSLLVPFHLVFVIDALDECKGTKAVPDIISLLSGAKALKLIQLRIFVTSRNEKHIVQSLRDKCDVLHLSLEEGVGASSTKHDISVYLKYQLSEIARKNEWKDWPEEREMEMLLQFCGDLFIAAATASRFLGNTALPKKRLAAFLGAGRTSGASTGRAPLDEMYHLLVDLAADCPDKDVYIEYFHLVLGAILVSKEPPSVSDLVFRLPSLDSELIRFVLDRLGSVLIVPRDNHAPIRLFHLSFRDFLVDKERCKDKNFFIDEIAAHRMSFEGCVSQISHFDRLKKDICGLKDPGTLLSDIDTNRIIEHIPWTVRYACQYWASHLENAEVSPSYIDGVDMAFTFIKKHLLHWIEALALVGRLDDAVNGTQSLKSIALATQNREFTEFVNDAQRFILYHRSTIQEAPLQVYYMATVFTPTQSLVRNQFSEHHPTWLRNPLMMESHWGPEEQVFTTKNPITDLAVSFDGRLVALLDSDAIHVRDAITGKSLHVLDVYLEEGRDDSFSLRAWSLTTGELIETLTQKQSDLLSLTDLHSWRCPNGHGTWQELRAYATRISLSPDGTTMCLFDTHRVYIGNTDTEEIHHVLKFDTKTVGFIHKVILSYTKAAIYFERDSVLWDLNHSRKIDIPIPTLDMRLARYWAFSPDGDKLAYGDARRVLTWNFHLNQVEQELEHRNQISQLALFPGGTKLIAAKFNPQAHVWDLQQPKTSIATPFTDDAELSLSGDGTKAILFRRHHPLEIWDLAKEIRILSHDRKQHPPLRFYGPLFAPIPWRQSEKGEEVEQSGFSVGSPTSDGENSTMRDTVFMTGLDKCVQLAISPDGTRIAIFRYYRIIETWILCEDTYHWKMHWSKRLGPGRSVTHMSFSSDGTRVLTIPCNLAKDCRVMVFHAKNGICEYRAKFSYAILCAALSHVPKMLAMGHGWGVEIRDIPSDSVKAVFKSVQNPETIAFSPQDTRIAVGTREMEVSIHNIATGVTEWKWNGQPSLVNILSFSTDDSWREEPYYTLDTSRQWILYDNKRVLAVPPKFHMRSFAEDYRASTMVFLSHAGQLATFMFDGAPSF